ncbi:MAG: hypothetical protein GTN73_00745 [Candidatus Aminicenantes bacterium]|nr:hypothetical protein [Candidatus Aminicenantes bacterium]
MRRKVLLTIALFILASQGYVVNGQFTPAEIAQRQEIEEFLKTAEIVRFEDIPEGVTKPIRLFLKKGDVEMSGAWKNPRGMQKGFLEGWQYEIAAYEMDKLLELNLIPPTVEREFKGKQGSLQFWVQVEFSELTVFEQKIGIPRSKFNNKENMKYLTRAFDSLIGNDDRTQQNILYTKDWRTILIDHSRAFRSSKKYTKKLMYGAKGLKKAAGRPQLFRRLPRSFVEKVKALNYDNIKNAVGPYLKEKEIKAILIRKELLLKEIEEMVKEQGEDKVLY